MTAAAARTCLACGQREVVAHGGGFKCRACGAEEQAAATVSVSADDLALVLYFPESVDYGEPDERGRFLNARCIACGQPGGAHYCAPREAARNRLWALMEARNATS